MLLFPLLSEWFRYLLARQVTIRDLRLAEYFLCLSSFRSDLLNTRGTVRRRCVAKVKIGPTLLRLPFCNLAIVVKSVPAFPR